MRVFISWSGQVSKGTARALRAWLPCVIQDVEPFMSEQDTEKSSYGLSRISKQLESADFAILCLTKQNLQSRWLHFETGVLAKSVGENRVIPLLVGLTDSDIEAPMSEFDCVKIVEGDIRRMLMRMNNACRKPLPDSTLLRTSIKWWPEFRDCIGALTRMSTNAAAVDTGLRQAPTDLPIELSGTVVQGAERIPQAVRSGGSRGKPDPMTGRFEAIGREWEKVIELVAKRRPSVGAFLRYVAQLRIEGETLVLGFAPDEIFARFIVDKATAVVEDAVESATGLSVRVCAEQLPPDGVA